VPPWPERERAIKVSTQASYGTLVHDLPRTPAGRLQWRWRLDQALTGGQGVADIQTKAGDDAALKVCVMFDHPLARVPFVERTKLRIARSVSGEDLPAATLCYVWDSVHPAGLRGANPYTARVRYITLQGQGASLAQWQTDLDQLAELPGTPSWDWNGQVLRLTRRTADAPLPSNTSVTPTSASNRQTVPAPASVRVVAWTWRSDPGRPGGGDWQRWQSPPLSQRQDWQSAWALARRWAGAPSRARPSRLAASAAWRPLPAAPQW
jgi:hypothetical protein